MPNKPTWISLLSSAQNAAQGDKEDIYQIGLILLEVITGKPTESQSQLESLKAQVNLKLHLQRTPMSLYFQSTLL